MLKVLLIIAVVAASVGLGNAIAENAGEKLNRNKLLLKAMSDLRIAVQRRGTRLFDALRSCATIPQLCALADELERRPYADVYETAEHILSTDKLLSKIVCRGACAFIAAAASATVEEELVEAFVMFEHDSSEIISALSEEQKKRSTVIRSVCLMGGMVLAVVLV